MAGPAHARLERLIWVLVYGGLLVLVLGLATGREDAALGGTLSIAGALVALAGFVLIGVRARLDRGADAQSPHDMPRRPPT